MAEEADQELSRARFRGYLPDTAAGDAPGAPYEGEEYYQQERSCLRFTP